MRAKMKNYYLIYKNFGILAKIISIIVVQAFFSHNASGYSALTVGNVNLRAGPDLQFPIIGVISEGVVLEIQGCEQDYQWCDVEVGHLRGWAKARFLKAAFEGREVIVANSGTNIGVPIAAFVIGAYWMEHYRDQSWYRRWDHWRDWHYRPRPPNWRPPSHRPSLHPPTHKPPSMRPPSLRPPTHRPPSSRPPNSTPGHEVGRPPSRPHPRPQNSRN